jgi:GDP-4-dehydro-6-deoxy-D-mannose reductase
VKPQDGVLPALAGADEVLPFDLMEPDDIPDLLRACQPDGLVHLAAQSSVGASFSQGSLTWHANLLGTVGLGEAVLKHRPHCRFILASSAEVYGLSFRLEQPLDETARLTPTNPYAASKAASDLAVGEMTLRGLSATRLRLFNHTGPGQSKVFALPAFARQIARIEVGVQEPVLRVGALERWRDFLDVRDVCAAYVAALAMEPGSAAVYNICSGIPRRIGDVLESLLARSSVRPRIEVEPPRLRPTDLERVSGNFAQAQQSLGWSPSIDWADTLDALLGYWRGRLQN